ncbi:hypothetical protein [Tsuneonella sp. SYSU-LHT278]|uniref:hypothetical protein n=1 Tax=Tsuneonella sediminis TaxID=3416089 RepID=UPI003F79B203
MKTLEQRVRLLEAAQPALSEMVLDVAALSDAEVAEIDAALAAYARTGVAGMTDEELRCIADAPLILKEGKA